MTDPALPQRSEIWLINFDPTVGTEIKKIRPAVVLSAIGKFSPCERSG
jgi:mRNA interferase MazF